MPNIRQKKKYIIQHPLLKHCVDAREIHRFLFDPSPFTTWLSRFINYLELQEGRDYVKEVDKHEDGVGCSYTKCLITVRVAFAILLINRNKRGGIIARDILFSELEATKVLPVILEKTLNKKQNTPL